MTSRESLSHLDAFDPSTGDLNDIIDTPKGSRNEFKYEIRRLETLQPLEVECDDHAIHPRNRSRKTWSDNCLVRVPTAA